MSQACFRDSQEREWEVAAAKTLRVNVWAKEDAEAGFSPLTRTPGEKGKDRTGGVQRVPRGHCQTPRPHWVSAQMDHCEHPGSRAGLGQPLSPAPSRSPRPSPARASERESALGLSALALSGLAARASLVSVPWPGWRAGWRSRRPPRARTCRFTTSAQGCGSSSSTSTSCA